MDEGRGGVQAQPGSLPIASPKPHGRCHRSRSSGSWGVFATAADFGKKEILLLNIPSFQIDGGVEVRHGKGRQSRY